MESMRKGESRIKNLLAFSYVCLNIRSPYVSTIIRPIRVEQKYLDLREMLRKTQLEGGKNEG